jgi:hypothetical protein
VFAVPDRWFWHGGSRSLFCWKPGQAPRMAATGYMIERMFSLEKDIYFSEIITSAVFRLKEDGTAEQVSPPNSSRGELVTCAAPFGPGELLVGTRGAGIFIFDGKTFRPFGAVGLLGSEHRINDLLTVGDGLFCAAVDTFGIMFFDRSGRILQVLNRSLDHRLARVLSLHYAKNGVLWALLNDGVARVLMPSPVSHFEPFLASGVTTSNPLRHRGELWIRADGRAMQGIYSIDDYLERFEDRTPEGRYIFTMESIDGQLFACSEDGIYVRDKEDWRLVVPDIVNARMGISRTRDKGIPYIARNEFGFIKQTDAGFEAQRIPVPGMGDTYEVVEDSAGILWLELGVKGIGRLDLHGANPSLQMFTRSEGIPDGWMQVYLIDGIARFDVPGHHFRFDDATRRFIEDKELMVLIPELAFAGGRPTRDSMGRLWYDADGTAKMSYRNSATGERIIQTIPAGFRPTMFTMEDNGVVWLRERGWLARFDPRMPSPPSAIPQAVITSVHLASSNRHLFEPGPTLAPLDFSDNSLVVRFAAPANPFVAPVRFEVMLEGAGSQWVSTGAVGSAAFDRLKEGNYVFHVRPTVGAKPGVEAQLAFKVLPPWFRSPLAWVLYVVVGLSTLTIAVWFYIGRERRKKEQKELLEKLVAVRTAELNSSNLQLEHQIEETVGKSNALAASE